MPTEQIDWNVALVEALRQIGERRVRLIYDQRAGRRRRRKFVTVIRIEGPVFGFLQQAGVLVNYLGLFQSYSLTKEGQVVAQYLINHHLDPHDDDSCYALDDTALNELAVRIGYGQMPKLRRENTRELPTLVPVEPSMVDHTDWPYGTR